MGGFLCRLLPKRNSKRKCWNGLNTSCCHKRFGQNSPWNQRLFVPTENKLWKMRSPKSSETKRCFHEILVGQILVGSCSAGGTFRKLYWLQTYLHLKRKRSQETAPCSSSHPSPWFLALWLSNETPRIPKLKIPQPRGIRKVWLHFSSLCLKTSVFIQLPGDSKNGPNFIPERWRLCNDSPLSSGHVFSPSQKGHQQTNHQADLIFPWNKGEVSPPFGQKFRSCILGQVPGEFFWGKTQHFQVPG